LSWCISPEGCAGLDLPVAGDFILGRLIGGLLPWSETVNIGAAEQASGLPAKTIRYYEDIGLLIPARQQNGYREYGRTNVHKLAFLKRAWGLGFSIEDCRPLMSLYEDRNRASADVKALAYTHLSDRGEDR
jgi:DNA-binding transcriptional MerR regulator